MDKQSTTPHRRKNRWLLAGVAVAFLLTIALACLLYLPIRARSHRLTRTKVLSAIAAISDLSRKIETFKIQNGAYPNQSHELVDLIERPAEADSTTWRRLLNEFPYDPWEHAYEYTFPAVHDPGSFGLRSAGPDGAFNTSDDIDRTTRP